MVPEKEQGVYYWEYDRNFNNKKFEDEFNKKFSILKYNFKKWIFIKVVLLKQRNNITENYINLDLIFANRK